MAGKAGIAAPGPGPGAATSDGGAMGAKVVGDSDRAPGGGAGAMAVEEGAGGCDGGAVLDACPCDCVMM